jgi:hypothetical protein
LLFAKQMNTSIVISGYTLHMQPLATLTLAQTIPMKNQRYDHDDSNETHLQSKQFMLLHWNDRLILYAGISKTPILNSPLGLAAYTPQINAGQSTQSPWLLFDCSGSFVSAFLHSHREEQYNHTQIKKTSTTALGKELSCKGLLTNAILCLIATYFRYHFGQQDTAIIAGVSWSSANHSFAIVRFFF